ncbi:MAG: c-type cytochrome [Polaromonas sp.]|nr:c-type cytochrome [Polaromonas sp.]
MPCSTPVFRAALLALLPLAAGLSGCSDDLPAAQHSAQATAQGDLAVGQRLLTQYQCGSCHAIPGISAARGIQGPSLEAFGKRSYIAGRVPNFPDALAQWLVSPQSLVPDTTMPAMGVSPDEARHMAAYLGSLE